MTWIVNFPSYSLVFKCKLILQSIPLLRISSSICSKRLLQYSTIIILYFARYSIKTFLFYPRKHPSMNLPVGKKSTQPFFLYRATQVHLYPLLRLVFCFTCVVVVASLIYLSKFSNNKLLEQKKSVDSTSNNTTKNFSPCPKLRICVFWKLCRKRN